MQVINAPDITPTPYGLTSVVQPQEGPQTAYRGQRWVDVCGHALGFTPHNCPTPMATVTGLTVTLQPDGTNTYPEDDFMVDWGDGSTDGGPDEFSHTYAADGTYTIEVTGPLSFGTWSMNVPVAADGSADATVVADYPGKEVTTGRSEGKSREFVVYAKDSCRLVGFDVESENLAVRAMNLGESHAYEQAMVTAFAATSIGTTTSPGLALAMAEQYAASQSPGRPIVHMQRALATLLNGNIERHGNRLETVSGSLVSAGTGYDDGAWGNAPTTRIYVSGQVEVTRGQMETHRVDEVQNNQVHVLSERPVSMIVNCFLGYVELNLSA